MQPGDRVGRYRLVRALGAGAMGEVWEAELEGPQGFRKAVALKKLRPVGTALGAADDLVQEARLGALLHHPNVVGVHALEEHDGAWVVVMELVRGASATQLMRRGTLSARAVLELGEQACAGLSHIHGLHIDGKPAHLVHRDIKPGNLLVDTHGTVKIADLGIAARAGTGQALGTPGYAPAEQLASRGVPASDLFALGVTLLVGVTHRRPFGTGHTALKAVTRADEILTEDPEPLRLADELVEGLGDVLARCLRTDPKERWPSAEALRSALVALRVEVLDDPGLVDLLAEVRPDLRVRASPTTLSSGPGTVSRLGNLPARKGAFVGRKADADAVASHLQTGQRLVLVQGPGGIGKTRLALEVAHRMSPRMSGGAWFLDLSEATNIDGVVAAAGVGLGLHQLGKDGAAQIGRALFHKGPALVVLDNLEQCRDAVRDLVVRWLDDAPDACFLGTSRMALELPDERVVHLDVLSQEDGVALFLQRVPSVPEEQRDLVAELVEAVDGIPLAIELAAARAKFIPVPMLLARLGPRMLSGGRDGPARQRSLEASLTWSWELLNDAPRQALAQLSVFEGAFDLTAAEAVLQLDDPLLWALDALQELANASFVRVDTDSGRFEMLRVVQDFARSRLEDATGAESRHGAWFAQVALEPRRDDLDNLVAAARRAIGRDDDHVAVPAALGAWALFQKHGPLRTGLELLEEVLPTAKGEGKLKVQVGILRALAALGRYAEAIVRGREWHEEAPDGPWTAWIGEALAWSVSDHGDLHEGGVLYRAAVEAHRTYRSDPIVASTALERLARNIELQGHFQEARRLYEEAYATGAYRPSLLDKLAGVYGKLGLREEAERWFARAMEAHRRDGNERARADALVRRGNDLLHRGRWREAAPVYEQALLLFRRTGDAVGEATQLANLAGISIPMGRLTQAKERIEASMDLHRRHGNLPLQAICCLNLAEVLHLQGQAEEARQSIDRAMEVLTRIGNQRLETHARIGRGWILADTEPEAARVELQQARDLAEQMGASVLLGRSEAGLGRAAADPAVAREHLGAALAIAQRTGDPKLEGTARTWLGEALRAEGHLAEARHELEEAERVLRELGDAIALADALVSLVQLDRAEGLVPAAQMRTSEVEAILNVMEACDEAPLRRRLRSPATAR